MLEAYGNQDLMLKDYKVFKNASSSLFLNTGQWFGCKIFILSVTHIIALALNGKLWAVLLCTSAAGIDHCISELWSPSFWPKVSRRWPYAEYINSYL